MLRKIEASKFAEVLLGCRIVCAGCFYYPLLGKIPQVDTLFIDADTHSRTIWAFLAELHALVSRSIALIHSPVRRLLSLCSQSQIRFSVVERVELIDVIGGDFLILRKIKNLGMHSSTVLPISHIDVSAGIKRACEWVPASMPLVFRDSLKVFRIYKRDLALGKWDFTVGCIRGCHIRSNQRIGFGGVTAPTPSF